MTAHRVRIHLTHVNDGRTPYKWRGDCLCGWSCLSWQWVRPSEDGGGGTLPMSLEHLNDHAQEG